MFLWGVLSWRLELVYRGGVFFKEYLDIAENENPCITWYVFFGTCRQPLRRFKMNRTSSESGFLGFIY